MERADADPAAARATVPSPWLKAAEREGGASEPPEHAAGLPAIYPDPTPSDTALRRLWAGVPSGMGRFSTSALLTHGMQHDPFFGLPEPRADNRDPAQPSVDLRAPVGTPRRPDDPYQGAPYQGAGPVPANRLLSALPQAEMERLASCMTRVNLVRDQVLIEQGQAIEHLFFLEGGVASMTADAGGGPPGVQVAMTGRESLVGGLALLTGDTVATTSTLMMFPGPALRIPVTTLWRLLHGSPALLASYMQCMQSLLRQIIDTAAHTARSTLAERCARWIVMAQDRLEADDLPVTHEALSVMLGVRRPGVTVALGALHDAGLIRSGRGRIGVLDRPGLDAAASLAERGGQARIRAPGRTRQSALPEEPGSGADGASPLAATAPTPDPLNRDREP